MGLETMLLPSSANASRRCVDKSPSRSLPVRGHNKGVWSAPPNIKLDSRRRSMAENSESEVTYGIESGGSPPSPSCF